MNIAKIEKFLQPVNTGNTVTLFFGTVIGIDGSTLVVETKSGGTVYAVSYVYCDIGDLVSCLSIGTTIIAFAAKDAQRVADDLSKIGLVYSAGDGITIDEDNRINAEVTPTDIQTLSTEIAGKANTTHTHSAADTTSGVFDLARLPTIPTSKLSGMIPSSMLPSFVDDVLEYASRSAFPATGESGKIYLDASTNKIYRWSGSTYAVVSDTIALGETSSTAYRGDRGKQAYDHISRTDNPHGVTYQQVGAAAEDHTHTPDEIGAAAASHTHPISNITNLQTTLNGKANASHTHEIEDVAGLQDSLDSKLSTTGTAAAATKLATARTIGLGGDASGSASFNGTTNVTIAATVLHHGQASIPSNSDLNSYTDPGWYYCPASATAATLSNCPTAMAFTMVVTRHAGYNQLLIEYMPSSYKIYTRNYYNNTWGSWQRVYTTCNKPTASEIGAAASSHTHAASQVTGLTASRALVSDSSGHPTVSAVTSTELSRLDGVTSNVQTQLNGKAATNHAHTLNGVSVASPSWFAPRSAGNAGQYLVSSGDGEPVWATIEGGVVFMPNGYPDDSVYLTYDPDFNPAAEFGGTWTKETQTYLFLGITIWRCVATPNQYFSPLDMYPVGTAFMTYDKAHNPAAEFGGTWTLEESTYMFLGIKIYRRVA